MNSLTNIVVGVDFSDFSGIALRQAMRIARWNEARLHVLHVVDTSIVNRLKDFWSSKRALLESQVTSDGIRDAAMTQLEELVARCEPGDVSVDIDVATGAPFVEILRRVQGVSADLLVLGSNGSSDPSRGAGALATKCVRKAATKVLLVRLSHAGRFKDVVACVDFSEMSHRVMEQAIRVAQQDQSVLHLLHVFTPPWQGLNYVPRPSEEMERQHEETLRKRLEDHVQTHEGETAGLEVVPSVVENESESDGVIRFAQESAPDLVVLGTRGRTGAKSILLGTVAEHVVRESPCSVLAIKPDDFKYDIG